MDVSGVELLRPSQIHHYVYGEWQGTLEIQQCLEGIFKILQLDPIISLLQLPEIDQILRIGEAPTHQVDPRSPLSPTRGLHTCNRPHMLWPMAQRDRTLRHVLYVFGVLVHPRPLDDPRPR